jgi:Cu2+-exporting ATPase
MPADKLAWLSDLRARGARVLAVGDGVNDAPVLAGAHVSIAMAEGADLAHASSDIVLAEGRLGGIAPARAIARQTLAIIHQNQRWALFYNLTAVPLAALGFVPPWLAAIGMSLSSLGVILNALRIGGATGRRRTRPFPAVHASIPPRVESA